MGKTILLIDDDRNLLESLRRTLHRASFEVLCASSAEEALRLMTSIPVDVVISDEEMPGRRGSDFLFLVREIYPDTVRMMLTGKGTLEVAAAAVNDGGITRFFIKPCNMLELITAIRQELEKRDLILAARMLLKKARRQEKAIQQIETDYPGITTVRRDTDGAALVEVVPSSLDQLMEEMRDLAG